MEFVLVRGGKGMVGSTAEEVARCVEQWGGRLADPLYTREMFESWILKEVPRHAVHLRPFRMSRFPVTNELYDQFIRDDRVPMPESLTAQQPGDWPVWGVSYDDSRCFARWMGRRMGIRFRLPTEAEWEYAARGPQMTEYPFGDRFDEAKCNTLEAGIGHPTPVDRYAAFPSGFGICDMPGNVEEWTSSRYRPYVSGTYITDDLTLASGQHYRILRGGSFARTGDLARCARRHGPHPGPAFRYRGFRLVSSA